MARTIDNLGVEISSRYAQDQETLDLDMLKEAPTISEQAKIAVTLPHKLSDFDAEFSIRGGIDWALSSPPPRYYASRKKLFAQQMIPCLGSLEKQEAVIEKLKLYAEQKGPFAPDSETHHSLDSLQALLSTLHTFDQTLIEINGRRMQYTKG